MSRAAANHLKKLIARTIGRGGMNSGPVIVRWRTRSGTAGNPNRESSQGDEVWTEHTETLQALIHYVSAGTTTYQRHSEVKAGDVILDFPGSVSLAGRKDVQFLIDDSGTTYVRAEAGRELEQAWDLRCGGVAITMTLLLRPQVATSA